ncbi:MAG: response regulator [Clostridiales bacterium]|jgi:two-component system chemotaxis response regulator CheY|nr:response regulator [Clostridiales bacterium]
MAKILIVDDASFMRMMIKDALQKNGYDDLHEAADGAQAVEKYDEINPDIVFMDITMPNMDGLEALKAIKGKHPEAIVVMCSAMGQESMVIEAIKTGARDFIVKPFKPDRIMKALNALNM